MGLVCLALVGLRYLMDNGPKQELHFNQECSHQRIRHVLEGKPGFARTAVLSLGPKDKAEQGIELSAIIVII